MKKERLEFFTDAVVAIIMTLMILEIKLPILTVSNLWTFLQHTAIYGLSFLVIAITWLNHHTMFINVSKINMTIIWINFAMLFSMSLIPLATSHLGEHFLQKESHMFYGAIMASVALPYTLLQANIYKLLPSKKNKEENRINKLNWTATILYVLSIPLSLLSVYISLAIFMIFPIVYFLLPKKLSE